MCFYQSCLMSVVSTDKIYPFHRVKQLLDPRSEVTSLGEIRRLKKLKSLDFLKEIGHMGWSYNLHIFLIPSSYVIIWLVFIYSMRHYKFREGSVWVSFAPHYIPSAWNKERAQKVFVELMNVKYIYVCALINEWSKEIAQRGFIRNT